MLYHQNCLLQFQERAKRAKSSLDLYPPSGLVWRWSAWISIINIPKKNAPENKSSQNERIVFQPSVFRWYVSFREGVFKHQYSMRHYFNRYDIIQKIDEFITILVLFDDIFHCFFLISEPNSHMGYSNGWCTSLQDPVGKQSHRINGTGIFAYIDPIRNNYSCR